MVVKVKVAYVAGGSVRGKLTGGEWNQRPAPFSAPTIPLATQAITI